ncbi:S-adenosyl-L-methionine-dependent methyltransferase, partial [Violaceomyces palustris]
PDAIGSAWSEASYVAGLYLKARTPYPQVIPHFIYDYHTYHVRRGDTLQPGWQAALDIGCGPGQLAIHLSTRFRRVLGIDPSEGMIALAETVKALGKEVLSSNGLPEVTQDSVIDYRKGFGESTNLSGKSVDLIVLGASAHCLDWSSPSATSSIWREWARILRPGGSLIITGTRPIVGPFVGPDGEKVGPLRDWLQNFALPPSPLATFYDQRVTEKSIGGGTMYSKIPMPWEQEDGDLCELWDSESKVHLVIDDPSPLNRSNQRIPSWASPALIRAIRGDNSNRDLIVTRTSPKHLTAWIRSTSGYRKMLEENFDQRLLALEERDVAAVEMKRICDESGIGWEEEMECHHPGTVLAIRRTRKEFPLGEATIKGT